MRQGWDTRQLFLLGLLIFVVPNLLRSGYSRPSNDIIIATLLSGIISITVHEFFHAFSAWKFGDDTAYNENRVNLNPVNHFDPLGFLGFALIAFGFTSIAWGKPVPVNFNRLKGDFQRRKFAMLVIAGCAPLSNVAMALIATVILRVISNDPNVNLGFAGTFLERFIVLNALLAAFNLIPMPPLDGYRILNALVPAFWYPMFAKMQMFGLFLPFMIIFIDGRLELGIYNALISPGYDAVMRMVIWILEIGRS